MKTILRVFACVRRYPWMAASTLLPQSMRFIVEEVLEGRIGFYPAYGKTLMGLAASVPLLPEDNFSITCYAPQPRAVLRVVDPQDRAKTVDYDRGACA